MTEEHQPDQRDIADRLSVVLQPALRLDLSVDETIVQPPALGHIEVHLIQRSDLTDDQYLGVAEVLGDAISWQFDVDQRCLEGPHQIGSL